MPQAEALQMQVCHKYHSCKIIGQLITGQTRSLSSPRGYSCDLRAVTKDREGEGGSPARMTPSNRRQGTRSLSLDKTHRKIRDLCFMASDELGSSCNYEKDCHPNLPWDNSNNPNESPLAEDAEPRVPFNVSTSAHFNYVALRNSSSEFPWKFKSY